MIQVEPLRHDCSKPKSRVGLVIPTLNAGVRWQDCLKRIKEQDFPANRVLVIDSRSTDSTVEQAKTAGFETLSIERSEFNHGGTRQLAVEHLYDCEIIVFLTQDALLASPSALSEIVKTFAEPATAVAYGRQLPHKGATPIEAFAREFNYGTAPDKKDVAAVARLGPKVFFCSNSFAAYRRSVLISLGGFRRDLILGEDMEFAARAVDAGYANVYCSTATVYHSHHYSVRQTLARYFDLGAFDADNEWMRARFGAQSGEGRRFVISELKYLARNFPLSIPRAMLLNAAKWFGYKLGLMHRALPVGFKKRVSMFPGFWSG